MLLRERLLALPRLGRQLLRCGQPAAACCCRQPTAAEPTAVEPTAVAGSVTKHPCIGPADANRSCKNVYPQHAAQIRRILDAGAREVRAWRKGHGNTESEAHRTKIPEKTDRAAKKRAVLTYVNSGL